MDGRVGDPQDVAGDGERRPQQPSASNNAKYAGNQPTATLQMDCLSGSRAFMGASSGA